MAIDSGEIFVLFVAPFFRLCFTVLFFFISWPFLHLIECVYWKAYRSSTEDRPSHPI
jgi:hypothetical protein